MSADGDFQRFCVHEAKNLADAATDLDRFDELVTLFQQAADRVREADDDRLRWLFGSTRRDK